MYRSAYSKMLATFFARCKQTGYDSTLYCRIRNSIDHLPPNSKQVYPSRTFELQYTWVCFGMKHSNDFSEPFETAPGRNFIWVPFTVRVHEKFYPPLTNSSYGHDCPSPSFASRITLELAVTITATAFHIGHSESGIPCHRIVSVRPTELKCGLIFCNAFVIWEIMDLLDAVVEMLSQFRVSDAYFTVTVVVRLFKINVPMPARQTTL
ncbi:hypothetical protein K438DRAFT_2084771 [Mycena galopus ATCC 62051]|nr:hypothetical protein K438DRAFT_2084771 [Mycena galopus ATCC 62051]